MKKPVKNQPVEPSHITNDDEVHKEIVNKKNDKHEFIERWKNPDRNKMGNDIAGEIKIANSNGQLEGGSDKRWHMEDGNE